MRNFEQLYSQAKEILLNTIPAYWPDMYNLTNDFVDSRLLPEVITPGACCKAVGGKIENSKEISAAILAAEISLRLLDDLEDKDKGNSLQLKIGVARTLNYIDAFRTVAYKILSNKCVQDTRFIKVLETFTDCYLIVLAGQERDLKGPNLNWEEAWKIIEMKTGFIYATTAAMGAMVGSDNEVYLEACRNYGYHLGVAIQIFNDMDGIWNPQGLSDLEQGKITLPLLYGLYCEHEANRELAAIVQRNAVADNNKLIIEILNNIDTKSYLIWAALKQRESALKAISVLPDDEGKQILEAHFTGMFGDIDELLGIPAANTQILDNSRLTDIPLFSINNVLDDTNKYHSVGLRLRRKVRADKN